MAIILLSNYKYTLSFWEGGEVRLFRQEKRAQSILQIHWRPPLKRNLLCLCKNILPIVPGKGSKSRIGGLSI